MVQEHRYKKTKQKDKLFLIHQTINQVHVGKEDSDSPIHLRIIKQCSIFPDSSLTQGIAAAHFTKRLLFAQIIKRLNTWQLQENSPRDRKGIGITSWRFGGCSDAFLKRLCALVSCWGLVRRDLEAAAGYFVPVAIIPLGRQRQRTSVQCGLVWRTMITRCSCGNWPACDQRQRGGFSGVSPGPGQTEVCVGREGETVTLTTMHLMHWNRNTLNSRWSRVLIPLLLWAELFCKLLRATELHFEWARSRLNRIWLEYFCADPEA